MLWNCNIEAIQKYPIHRTGWTFEKEEGKWDMTCISLNIALHQYWYRKKLVIIWNLARLYEKVLSNKPMILFYVPKRWNMRNSVDLWSVIIFITVYVIYMLQHMLLLTAMEIFCLILDLIMCQSTTFSAIINKSCEVKRN